MMLSEMYHIVYILEGYKIWVTYFHNTFDLANQSNIECSHIEIEPLFDCSFELLLKRNNFTF